MFYQKFGIREFRANLSSILSNVERNQQRIIIGKNNEELAVLVPTSDLDTLNNIDESKALKILESEDVEADSSMIHSGFPGSEGNVFEGFEELPIDNSRYEPSNKFEPIAPTKLLNVFDDKLFEYEPLNDSNSIGAELSRMQPENKALFDRIHKMVDEAASKQDDLHAIYNAVAACLVETNLSRDMEEIGRRAMYRGKRRSTVRDLGAAYRSGLKPAVTNVGAASIARNVFAELAIKAGELVDLNEDNTVLLQANEGFEES